jgi:helicase MOV-10
VGSVEQTQGQERKVIIISTVRSNKEYIKSDMKHNPGFLVNRKRFNARSHDTDRICLNVQQICSSVLIERRRHQVAITRMQVLMIVIGNPYVLAQDEHWVSLLNYAAENKAYTGCSRIVRS